MRAMVLAQAITHAAGCTGRPRAGAHSSLHPARTSIQDHGPCVVETRLGRGCGFTLPCWTWQVWGWPLAWQSIFATQVCAPVRVVGPGRSRGSSHPVGVPSFWTRSAYQPTVGDVFSLGTLVITFFAVVIALLAYQVSTGSPDLELGIMLYGEEPYCHVLQFKTSDKRWVRI